MKVCSFRKFKGKTCRGPFNIFVFFGKGGEQAFVVVIKHLIDFDGKKTHAFLDGLFFYSIKMNIKDRTTGYVSITSNEITLSEQDQGKVR